MVFIPTSGPQYKSLPNIDIQDRSTLQDLFENILGDDYENIDISMDEEYDEDDNTTEVIEIGWMIIMEIVLDLQILKVMILMMHYYERRKP